MPRKKDPNKPKGKRGNPALKKGVQPEWLVGKGFDGHPEHINRYGIPSDIITLRKMVQQMGNEPVVVENILSKDKMVMTRFERILFDWFNSQSFDKQQAIMQYGLGKVPDKLELSGSLKTIVVTIKKKEETE